MFRSKYQSLPTEAINPGAAVNERPGRRKVELRPGEEVLKTRAALVSL